MYLTKEAMTFLDQALHLPATGREQDWDIELADANRANEFIRYLGEQSLSEDVKLALMALIIASLEDLSYQETIPPDLWEKVRKLLREDPPLYADLVQQWSPKDGDDFAISSLIEAL